MKYLAPYRIATYRLVLFCVAHTAGGMLAQKSRGADSDAVFSVITVLLGLGAFQKGSVWTASAIQPSKMS